MTTEKLDYLPEWVCCESPPFLTTLSNTALEIERCRFEKSYTKHDACYWDHSQRRYYNMSPASNAAEMNKLFGCWLVAKQDAKGVEGEIHR